MTQTPSTTGSFNRLQSGDLFVATDSDGKTYKVPYSRVDDIIKPLPSIIHIRNIRNGFVEVTDHDYITDLSGNRVSDTRFTAGEYLIYGDTAILKESTGDWDFGPLTNTIKRKNFYNFLKHCDNFNGDISHIRIDGAENTSYMFAYCHVFNQSVAHFDTSKVNTMRGMFVQCHKFNQPVNHFNTSACENFQIVFSHAFEFNQPLDNWNVDHGITFLEMFNNTSFTQDISGWDVSRAKKLQGMFRECPFNGDISGWNTSNVTNMNDMFSINPSFNQDLSQWCVPLIPSKPSGFDYLAFQFRPAKHPVWGTCPRGEDQA